MTRTPCQRNQINMIEHSKEPWRINGYTGASLHPSVLVETSDGNGSIALIVCNANPRANAARIVACVNFCAGLSDFRLTQDSVQTLELKMDGYKAACDLRMDEIAALKSRAEQAEHKLAKAIGILKEYGEEIDKCLEDKYTKHHSPRKELREILNEKEAV